jgi:hypothetical protein
MIMQCLTTDLMGQACKIFLTLAYPGGEAAIPAAKRHLLGLPAGLMMLDHLDGDPVTRGFCQVAPAKTADIRLLLLRLGCRHYPNLKLKAQLIDDDPQGEGAWLFSVDTHDGFSSTSFLPPPDHPEAAAWLKIQADNVALKQQIEAAWEQAGLLTFNGLLRRDLPKAHPSFS